MFKKLKLITEHNDTEGILNKQCVKVEDPKSKFKELNQMVEIMKANNGVGLASPQVGLNDMMFVFTNRDGIVEHVINPEIIKTEKRMVNWYEGCLSYPKRGRVEVKRHYKIKVRYHNGFVEITKWLKGLEARIFAHEHDHLMGQCIVGKEV